MHDENRIKCESFWPMLRDIRKHVEATSLKILAGDDVYTRSFYFATDCDPEDANYRYWEISNTKVRTTAKICEVFLDGNTEIGSGHTALIECYASSMRSIEGRKKIADALTTGKHPEESDAIDPMRDRATDVISIGG